MMSHGLAIHLIVAATLLVGGLVFLRAIRLPQRPWPAPGDAAVAIIMWSMTVLVTLRPVGSATLVACVLVFVGIADRLKRSILREPALFADGSELLQVFFYPRFYVPYAGAFLVYGLSTALALAAATALALEPAQVSGLALLACVGMACALLAAVYLLYKHAPAAAGACIGARRMTRDPWRDTAYFGTLGAFAVHAFAARAERPALRLEAASHFGIIRIGNCRPHLLLVQAESFFDVRRLGPEVPWDALPNFSGLQKRATQHGLLETPAWGGYTMRTEFLALSGLAPAHVGLDITNPYHAFARQRIDGLVWRIRDAGYRTICVHPFDRRFYRRDLVMPLLGFEQFLGAEYFAADIGPDGTASDEALADGVNRLFENTPDPLFIFAITAANHGPWGGRSGAAPGDDLALADYIEGCRATDRMIGQLADAPWAKNDGAMLAFYGDHMPILPATFDACQFDDARPDYAIAFTGRPRGVQRDITASMLPRTIAEMLSADAADPGVRAGDGTGIAKSIFADSVRMVPNA
jgi:hypothetical protein